MWTIKCPKNSETTKYLSIINSYLKHWRKSAEEKPGLSYAVS